MDDLFKQLKEKTLTVIDEYGTLFDPNPSYNLKMAYMMNWIIFVTPLFSAIFDKLLSMNNVLSSTVTVRDKVMEITNCITQELMKLSNGLNDNCDNSKYLDTSKIINFLIQFGQD
ncbi:hypothetical protein RhiirA5_430292 [Rhizophagus irregularis]|uniref:Uncharacterized protein n=1 Tax=Rhizophagus irregularis TaxID=588596 RepID=A0A2I1FDB9_9GLOM|nr:hypothetical protein RhiirA5_430292 [Rhizophagus irregularis]PKY32348.1 hypothetical protein RhiirB3_450470 [Rhizophagus irregularis]